MSKQRAAELFDPLDEDKRRQLLARGWHEAAGTIGGRLCWRMPHMGGAIVEEGEAFQHLKRLLSEESRQAALEVEKEVSGGE